MLTSDQQCMHKIKQNIEVLTEMLVVNERYMSPVLLALSQHSQDMSDWLLETFLGEDKKEAHAKMVLEIIISDKHNQLNRLLKLHKFIMNSFTHYHHQTQMHLSYFIKTFCQVIRIIGLQNIKAGETRVNKSMSIHLDEIHQLLDIFQQFSNKALQQGITSLLVTLLYQPAPFQQRD